MERPPLQLKPEQPFEHLQRSAGEVVYAHELETGKVVKGISHGVHEEQMWLRDEDGELDTYPLTGWQFIVEREQSDGQHTI